MTRAERRGRTRLRFFVSAFVMAALLAILTQLSAHSREAAPAAPAASIGVSAESSAASPETPSPAPTSTTAPAAPAQVGEAGKVLYFTFDDGPSPAWTPRVLDLLGDHGATATFFQVGGEAARHPALVDLVRERGHSIGNHTWNHPDLTRLSVEDVRSQLIRTAEVIGATTCARPPMGATNAQVREVYASLGQTQQLWDIDTRDWERRGSASIVETVLTTARDGAVVLLHDGGGDRGETVAALAELLPRLAEAGWRIEGIPGC